MSDQELYNKYRPTTFNEIVGQDHVTKVLESYIKSDSLPQSMIYYGSPGCGKTSTARIVASILNPHESGTVEVNSAVDGKVDDMRSLERDILHYPISGDHKTYIFDEAHRISSAGFDSLLKTIEEPPSHVTFIFVTTNVDQIPGTIKSRSDLHTFFRINGTVVETRLKEILKTEGVVLTQELIDIAVEAGAGSLRDSIVALHKIITMYRDNQAQVDIVKSLGVVGPKGLTEFCLSYITNNHARLHSASACFNPDIVNPLKAVHSLQRFVLDARACLLNPDLCLSVESNVELFLKEVYSEIETAFSNSLPGEQYLSYTEQCLLYLYDVSLMLESDLSRTTNHKSRIDRFVIELVKSRA